MSNRICRKCNIKKPIINFPKDTSKRHDVSYYCKECAKAKNKLNYEKRKAVNFCKILDEIVNVIDECGDTFDDIDKKCDKLEILNKSLNKYIPKGV